MQILWNGEEITKAVRVSGLIMHDMAGGKADSIEIFFSDPEQTWTKWKPQKGDLIEAREGDFSSGVMYFDGWEFEGQLYKAMAISTPPAGKSTAFRSWDNATFIQIARDISNSCGLTLNTYDIIDYTYGRVNQIGAGNLDFLDYICKREGYSLKITNGMAVIFSEKAFEQKPSVRKVNRYDMLGRYRFRSMSIDLKSSCTAKYFAGDGSLLEYRATAPGIYGGEIRIDEHLASISEAQRFTKAALRQANKNEYNGFFKIHIDSTLAAGVCIDISGIGVMDGKWYIDRVSHDILNGYTYCWVRKPIEGDY